MSSELTELLQHVDEAAFVRPGDTLVLRVGPDISAETFHRVSEDAVQKLKKCLPGVEVLLVGGVEQMVVHRPGEAEGDPA